MAECNHDCSNCSLSGNCESEIKKAKLNDRSKIKKIIGVLSGKGGVGKSYITSLLAVYLNRQGYKVGILDADITGPSIPKAFGIKDKAYGEDNLIYPLVSNGGVKLISANCLLENESDPIVWRGPLLGGLIKQFYEDVLWEELDYLLIDMPPGTGDVALTIFQQLPVDDLIIVTSPQDLVSLIVTKAIKMANMMNIPVLGIVENMSYYECPDCGKKHAIFGDSHIEKIALEHNIPVVAKLPIEPVIAETVDHGRIETLDAPWLKELADKIENE
jgi:Mrp family chromosome partitioning ATPase